MRVRGGTGGALREGSPSFAERRDEPTSPRSRCYLRACEACVPAVSGLVPVRRMSVTEPRNRPAIETT